MSEQSLIDHSKAMCREVVVYDMEHYVGREDEFEVQLKLDTAAMTRRMENSTVAADALAWFIEFRDGKLHSAVMLDCTPEHYNRVMAKYNGTVPIPATPGLGLAKKFPPDDVDTLIAMA